MFGTFGRKTLAIMLICIGAGIRDSLIQILTQLQRLFSDINLHVMSLRFGDFRVGTTDFFAAKTRLRREWHVNG